MAIHPFVLTKIRTGLTTLCSTAALTACTVGVDYQAPPIEAAREWYTLTQAENQDLKTVTQQLPVENTQPSPHWWERLGDPVLNRLVEEALKNNYDLKIAEARILEARANEAASFGALLPQIDASGSATREKLAGFNNGVIDNSRQAGVRGTWEIDIFGANRRRNEAAAANAESAEAERDRTMLALITDVARNYIRLRSTQEQYSITLKNLNSQQGTLDAVSAQREEQIVSNLEVIRAQSQVDTTASRLPQINTNMVAAMHRLEILGAKQPGTWRAELSQPGSIPNVPHVVVVDTPVDIIRRRPDIASAERRLAAATALSAAAFADLFPKISLEGFFGVRHSDVFGSISPWSGTLNGLLPLLNFGRLQAAIDAADARQQQALYEYQQTVLLALEETENALTAYMNEQRRQATIAALASRQATAVDIAREQYNAGIVAQLDLLQAERDQLDAENELALSTAAVAENLVILSRALGEGNKKYREAAE